MKTLRIIAVLTLVVIAAALLTASAYAYMGGRIGTPFAANSVQTGTSYGGYYGGMMGGGMMGGYGYYNSAPVTTVPQQSGTPSTTTSTTPSNQYPIGGWGCPGMRNIIGYSAPSGTVTTSAEPLNITSALAFAKNYLTSTGNTNLAIAQLEEYTQNVYVQIKEKDTNMGAFELIINKYTGVISPEMGPNMMWNTKYGMMNGGILGGVFGAPTTMTVTPTQATTNAQTYLTTYLQGTTTGDVTTFYGYYNIEILNSSTGTTYGMLSVNGYTGQVWFHNWHGTFIQELVF